MESREIQSRGHENQVSSHSWSTGILVWRVQGMQFQPLGVNTIRPATLLTGQGQCCCGTLII